MKARNSTIALYFAVMVSFVAIAAEAKTSSLLDMSDQLDKLDHQDFQSELDKANECTRSRNFSCSEDQLRKASKLASSNSDRQALNAATQNLQAERRRVDDEARAKAEQERQIRLAEERRREDELREQREEDERRRERRRREQEEDDSADSRHASQDGWNKVIGDLKNFNAQMAATNRQTNQLYAQALQQKQEENRAAQREADRRAQDEADRRERARRRDDEDRRAQNDVRARQIARQQEQDRIDEQARKDEQARQQAQQQARERERAREQERVRKQEEARQQEQEKKRAEREYLNAMRNGIRLGVKNCYGQYEVGGRLPNIKPEVVSCIDVHYRARCAGRSESYDGVIKTFTGFDVGCFGDTATISPKPACPVAEVRIEVVDVVGCGG